MVETSDGVDLASDGAASFRAHVPSVASDAVRVSDPASGVSAEVTLGGAGDVAGTSSRGVVAYPHALGDAGVVRRVLADGAEDLVVFETKPEVEELRYTVRLSGAKAIHVAHGGRIELVDAGGAPRIAVPPAETIDAAGVRHAASMRVEGCAVDADPRPPWHRELVAPGADECEIVVDFHGATYPLAVDPEWKSSGNMIDKRTHHTATLLSDNTILIAGGFDETGAGLASAEIMCPAETCPPSATFTPAGGSLVTACGAHTDTLVAGPAVLYTGGRGTRAGAALPTAEICALPSFTCTSVSMSTARVDHTATLLANGKVLVAGGDGANPSTAQVYDPTTNSFGSILTMTAKRTGHAAELLQGNGRVLIAGGIGTLNIAVSTAELFDPATSTFTPTGNMTSQRAFATATRLEDVAGSVLVAGGTNGVGFYYKTADIYVPNGNGGSFQQQPVNMQVSRAFHRATKLLGTGTVLLTGGFDGTNVLANTEVFDKNTVAFTLASTMLEARDFHTATVLASGQAIVTGGGFNPNTSTVDVAAASSTEILQRSNGEACSSPGECASGFCVSEGTKQICCDAQCDDVCSSCLGDAVEPNDGTCHVVADGTLVGASCTNTVQLELTCVADHITAGSVILCSPYNCKGLVCGSGACASDAECAPNTSWCSPTGCKLKQDQGTECTISDQCKSGFCVDGYCCNSKCDGQCEACDGLGSAGLCTQVDGDVRTATLKNGTPTGRMNCLGFGTDCAGTCKTNVAKCDYAPNDCGTPTCADGMASAGKCSVTDPGTCVMATSSCNTFACNATTGKCNTTCATNDDCASGDICKTDGSCVLVESTECDGDHTLYSPDGSKTDCSPFKCNEAACINRCNSVDDCVGDNVCNDKGECVAPPPNPAAPSGCAVAPAGGSSTGAAGALAALAALACATRRRSAGPRARRSTGGDA